jgi:hypothetical protein
MSETGGVDNGVGEKILKKCKIEETNESVE